MKKIQYYSLIVLYSFYMVGCGSSGGTSSSSDSAASTGSVGKGGSMARFAISGDYLYTINQNEMELFDISEPSHPYPHAKVQVPFDVQTLFSYKTYLYIGAESGMYIYDNSTPSNPTHISDFTHAKSCDPVVVEDDLAFITLNKGSTCRLNSGENTLQVVDIKNPEQPKLLKTMGMWSPKGLGIDDGTLFVCDDSAGLKVFDVTKYDHNETNETRVDLLLDSNNTLKNINCYDLIAYKNNLIVSNGDDVRQFDYSHFPMVELGKIK